MAITRIHNTRLTLPRALTAEITGLTLEQNRATHETTDYFPVADGFDNLVSPPAVRSYDCLVQAHGAAGTSTRSVRFRTVEVPYDIDKNSPLVISNIFQNVHLGSFLFTVVYREDTASSVLYDVFYETNTDPGATNWNLHVYTVKVPPGRFESPFPQFPSTTNQTMTYVKRMTAGVVYYDLFVWFD